MLCARPEKPQLSTTQNITAKSKQKHYIQWLPSSSKPILSTLDLTIANPRTIKRFSFVFFTLLPLHLRLWLNSRHQMMILTPLEIFRRETIGPHRSTKGRRGNVFVTLNGGCSECRKR